MGLDDRIELSALVGKTLIEVRQVGKKEIYFTTEDGDIFKMHHNQECCENVYIEEIKGDLQSLVGQPILLAEQISGEKTGPVDEYLDDSWTWSFYKIATLNDHVDLHWYGTSNGYHSELVDFEKATATSHDIGHNKPRPYCPGTDEGFSLNGRGQSFLGEAP